MAGWDKLAQNLEKLSKIPSQLSKPVAEELNKLINTQFANGQDPYGKPWMKLQPSTIQRKGHDSILIETGKLAAQTVAVPMSGAGIELRSVDYGQFHQSGTRYMVAREILPGREELPKAWQAVIAKAYSDRMTTWDRSGV